jgi:hypothetical protein
VPAVATYEVFLTIDRPVSEVFAFVSDFRNAATWDPRTYSVEKATAGPIGVGTRFVLTGGMLPEPTVQRLHLSTSVAGLALSYDVVEFDAPREFVLEGEAALFRYRDHLEFAEDGGETRLRYTAELELKGILGSADALLQRMFQRIGDDATRELPATVERGTTGRVSD